MWKVTSEEALTCTECYHPIQAGEECLSQMPKDMPDKIRRRNYEKFCIGCTRCDSKEDKPPCYVRRVNHWYVHSTLVEGHVSCVHCNVTIPEGRRAIVQTFYAWPDSTKETVSDDTEASTGGSVPGISFVAKELSVGKWHSLSNDMQNKLKNAGLGNGRGGARTAMEAEQFYESSIPYHVRNGGESAVKDFIRGRDASHIKSVHNSPSQAKDTGNTLWENAHKNRVRGSRNMNKSEIGATKLENGLRGAKVGGKAALRRGIRGGVIAGAIELPIAAAENFLHWKRDRKSGKQAIKDTASKTGVTAGVSGLVCLTTFLLPISLGPLAMPVAILGGTVWAGSSIYRVAKAAKLDIPLDEYRVFFCSERACRSEFAHTVTNSKIA